MDKNNETKRNYIMGHRPLIVLTNDDGIQSPGLWAIAEAFSEFGEILIAAPQHQQSGAGRSVPLNSEGRIHPYPGSISGHPHMAYAIEGTPAQCIQHAVLELVDRSPALVVSGINYGANLGDAVTLSGTVGAALEAASLGIPAMAVSLDLPQEYHYGYSEQIDFSIAARRVVRFGQYLLDNAMLGDIDLLKVDLPHNLTLQTPWRVTRLSHQRVYHPTRPQRESLSDVGRLGYTFNINPAYADPDSDVYAVLHQRVISVTPMSLDMTSRINLHHFYQSLEQSPLIPQHKEVPAIMPIPYTLTTEEVN